MTDLELKNVIGGTTTSVSSVLNSIVKLFNIVLELGRNVGSALNYAINKKVC